MPRKKQTEEQKPKVNNPNVLGLHAEVVEQPITETLEELKQVINDNVSTSIMQIQLDGKGLEDYQENVTIEWYCLQ